MPVTLKKSQIKYKDPSTGNYVGVDAVAEKTTAEMVSEITTTAQTKMNALNTRATEIEASYPDVQEMEDMVAEPFVQSKAYPAGKQVIQAVDGVNKLFILPDGHNAGDAWGDTSKLGPYNLGDQVSDLKSAIDGLSEQVGDYTKIMPYLTNTLIISDFPVSVSAGTKIRYKVYGLSSGTGTQVRVYGKNGSTLSPSFLDYSDYNVEGEYTFTESYEQVRLRLSGSSFAEGTTAKGYIKVVSGETIEKKLLYLLTEMPKALRGSDTALTDGNITTYLPSKDLDDITDCLIYYMSSLTDATHKPISTMTGVFCVLRYNSLSANGRAQLFLSRTGLLCFRTHGSSTGWTDWVVINNAELTEKLTALTTEFHELSPYETSINLFDRNNCEAGDFNSSGNETDSENVTRTVTPVRISGDYIVSNYKCRKVFYKADMTFANIPGTDSPRSASTTDPVQIPSDAAYVRFSMANNFFENTDIMANVGTEILPFRAFSLFRSIDKESLVESMKMDNAVLDATYTNELYKTFKRVGVCGDSLSVGYSGHTGTYPKVITRNLEYSWVKSVGRDADAYWLNFGEHGMNVLTWCSSETRGKVQMEAENNKCQMYIICLGVNDSTPTGGRHVDVGQASDIVDNPDTVATTYYGGFARIIQLIKRRNPDARIFCSTIPDEQRSSANRQRYKPYNDAVRYIAGTYYTPEDNVFLLDIAADYGNLFITPGYPLYIEQVGDNRVSHFSSVGYQMIGKIYADAISKVMIKYHPKFMDIMYIPCDTSEPTADTMVGYEEENT